MTFFLGEYRKLLYVRCEKVRLQLWFFDLSVVLRNFATNFAMAICNFTSEILNEN